MKIAVSTGHTKAPAGTLVSPIVLGDDRGERIFAVLQCSGKAAGIETFKEECELIFHHSIMDAEGDAYSRLESALKEVNGLMKGMQLSDSMHEVHAIVGVLEKDGNLHLSHVGRAEAYLIRGGQTTQITEYSRGKQPSFFLHIVSGPLERGDSVILSSQRLLRAITPAQLANMTDDGDTVHAITSALDSEHETACVLYVSVADGTRTSGMNREEEEEDDEEDTHTLPPRSAGRMRGMRRKTSGNMPAVMMDALTGLLTRAQPALGKMKGAMKTHVGSTVSKARGRGKGMLSSFLADLSDPKRKRRAHMLLIAGGAGLFLVLWLIVQLSLTSQQSQTKGELATLIQQINSDITNAENQKLAGNVDQANSILVRAENRARQVMGNENGFYRSEALDLLDKIRAKKEEMNNIVRLPPKLMANISAKKSDVVTQGMIGLSDGEFLVYDRQDVYRVLLNSVDGPTRALTEELLVDGEDFARFSARVFLTTGNSIVEFANNQAVTMKTEDTAGWMTGVAVETYLRYLYILSPERGQIYKYERLSGRYGPAVEYNVNGDLKGALDMSITGPVYVLRDTGATDATQSKTEVMKLLRGEKQTFNIRNLPQGALDGVTKIFKSGDVGNIYLLDPLQKRIIVTTHDGDLGDSLYVKQYILDSDQVSRLTDLYVDPEDTRLYVLDEKRLYVIDLQQ